MVTIVSIVQIQEIFPAASWHRYRPQQGPSHDDIRVVCLVTPSGRLECNYVPLCAHKTLPGHFSPCHITVLSGISSLPREKNTDGTLELMCSGLNGPWTFWHDLLCEHPWKRKMHLCHLCPSCAALPLPLSLSLWLSQGFNLKPRRSSHQLHLL